MTLLCTVAEKSRGEENKEEWKERKRGGRERVEGEEEWKERKRGRRGRGEGEEEGREGKENRGRGRNVKQTSIQS